MSTYATGLCRRVIKQCYDINVPTAWSVTSAVRSMVAMELWAS
jgi:hypothetical protein